MKLLSICIPTRNRIDILKKTLDSIFSSNADEKSYEVVIYDSSDNNELEILLKAQYAYSNLLYKRGRNSGYLNLIEALRLGQGAFLKLHNDYSEFVENALEDMVNLVKENLLEKKLMFFTNDILSNADTEECCNFNDFLYNVSYQSTWATAFGIWKIDFDALEGTYLEPMFPHTSLLFKMTDKVGYLIDNTKIFNNQAIHKKGGYNLFNTFAVTYLSMVVACSKSGVIKNKTYQHIKKDMLSNFLTNWYCDTKILKNEYTFGLSDIKLSMTVYYSNFDYYKMVVSAYIQAGLKLIKKTAKIVIANKTSGA